MTIPKIGVPVVIKKSMSISRRVYRKVGVLSEVFLRCRKRTSGGVTLVVALQAQRRRVMRHWHRFERKECKRTYRATLVSN